MSLFYRGKEAKKKVKVFVPLTHFFLSERQIMLHQILRCAEGGVHSAADQLHHSALQHRAHTTADNCLGLLHAILHSAPSPLHNTAQSPGDRVLGTRHSAGHSIFSRGYHTLGTGNNLSGYSNDTEGF